MNRNMVKATKSVDDMEHCRAEESLNMTPSSIEMPIQIRFFLKLSDRKLMGSLSEKTYGLEEVAVFQTEQAHPSVRLAHPAAFPRICCVRLRPIASTLFLVKIRSPFVFQLSTFARPDREFRIGDYSALTRPPRP
jgi:hypothetical protein